MDLAIVDVLARVQLELRRTGIELRLRDPPPELVELIELAGLGDVLVADGPARDDRPGEQGRRR
jgi:anti-anti-sigma regulatory factor